MRGTAKVAYTKRQEGGICIARNSVTKCPSSVMRACGVSARRQRGRGEGGQISAADCGVKAGHIQLWIEGGWGGPANECETTNSPISIAYDITNLVQGVRR